MKWKKWKRIGRQVRDDRQEGRARHNRWYLCEGLLLNKQQRPPVLSEHNDFNSHRFARDIAHIGGAFPTGPDQCSAIDSLGRFGVPPDTPVHQRQSDAHRAFDGARQKRDDLHRLDEWPYRVPTSQFVGGDRRSGVAGVRTAVARIRRRLVEYVSRDNGSPSAIKRGPRCECSPPWIACPDCIRKPV